MAESKTAATEARVIAWLTEACAYDYYAFRPSYIAKALALDVREVRRALRALVASRAVLASQGYRNAWLYRTPRERATRADRARRSRAIAARAEAIEDAHADALAEDRAREALALVNVRVTEGVAHEYAARGVFMGDEEWPFVPAIAGTYALPRATARAMYEDACYHADTRDGPEYLASERAPYRALVRQLRAILGE